MTTDQIIALILKWLGLDKKEDPMPKPKPIPIPKPIPKPSNRLYAKDDKLFVESKRIYLCGIGDPENFLFRNEQNKILNQLPKYGGNALIAYTVMSHHGDGKDKYNPFVAFNPMRGVREIILSRWHRWFERASQNGITTILNLYDDSSLPFGDRNTVIPKEREYIEPLVQKFRDIPLLIWMIAEEFQEAMTRKKASEIARIIKTHDDHPVGIHQLPGEKFMFPNDSNIDIFFIQLNQVGAQDLRPAIKRIVRNAQGRYVCCLFESTEPGMNSYGSGKIARVKDRICAAAGAHVLRYCGGKFGFSKSDLKDMRRLQLRMEKRYNG